MANGKRAPNLKGRIPVLEYHLVGDSNGRWTRSRESFRKDLELLYGVLCWRVFRGSRALLVVSVAFNLANLSLFFADVPGPEGLLAGREALLVSVILVQLVATLWAVGLAAGPRRGPEAAPTHA